jgi:hypothetical protein
MPTTHPLCDRVRPLNRLPPEDHALLLASAFPLRVACGGSRARVTTHRQRGAQNGAPSDTSCSRSSKIADGGSARLMDALAKSGVRAASFTFRTKMLWAWQYSRMSWLHDAYCFSRLLACVCNLQHAFPGWRRLSQSVPAGSAQRARARARRGPSREERRPAVQRGEPKRRLGLRRRHGAGAGPRGWRGRGRGRAARRPATYSVGTQVCGVRKTSPSFVLPPAWDFAAAAWPPLVLLRGDGTCGRAGARGAGRGARGAGRGAERASLSRSPSVPTGTPPEAAFVASWRCADFCRPTGLPHAVRDQ